MRVSARHERGSVTAELAVTLPAVTALLALLLLGGSAGIMQLRLEEAARSAARAMARGDTASQAETAATSIAGGSAHVQVSLDDGYAQVTVSGQMTGPLSGLMAWEQSAKATARLETDPQTASQFSGHATAGVVAVTVSMSGSVPVAARAPGVAVSLWTPDGVPGSSWAQGRSP